MLLERLIQKQRDNNQTDEEFADFLGVPRSTWQLTRSGVKPVARRIAVAAAKTFPDLKPLVVSFLLSDAAYVAKRAATIAS